MRILLQNVQTKLYFTLLGVWTHNPSLAYDFRHSDYALEFVQKNELTGVQLMVTFLDPRWDQVVPLPLAVATLPVEVAA